MTHSRLDDSADTSDLTFYCGDLPVDAAVVAAGHEPNGYFWESVVTYLDAGLVDRLDLDSEAGMFAARGSRPDLERLQSVLEPLLADPRLVGELIERAEADGFEFDD